MARFDMLHRDAYVELPDSISGPPVLPVKRFGPSLSTWLGIVGFLCYGVAVITAANLLALQIQ